MRVKLMRMKFSPGVWALLALALAARVGHAEPLNLTTPTGVIAGTLELPKTKAPCPLVLIIAGSGPTDRDGNSAMLAGKNDSLKLLAAGLAAQGIASVRYDKRGIAASAKGAPAEADLRFDTYVSDAVAWCQSLRQDKRFSALFIAGHSEGALIGLLAAQKVPVAGYVSIAGAGEPAADILRTQLKPKLPPEMMQTVEGILKKLEAGKTVDNTPPALGALFRPSVQPYLISWFRYDPAQELKKLKVPTLLVQGSTDIQVQEADVARLAKSRPDAKVLRIKGMNHVLKLVPSDTAQQIASYSDPKLSVAPQLIAGISAFVRAHTPTPKA